MKSTAVKVATFIICSIATLTNSVIAEGEKQNIRGLSTDQDRENLRILVPKEGPDPEPQLKLRQLKNKDPTPIDFNCRATSQLELIIPKDGKKNWMVQSLDISGNKKKIGGDEYYMTFVDDSFASVTNYTATAYATDLGDGTYSLNFVGTRKELPADVAFSGKGILTIFLQYTCDIGKIWPPGKEKWQSSGALYRTYKTPVVSPPTEPPTPLKLEKNLSSYDVVLAAGDSVMTQLFCIKLRMRRKNMFMHKNLGIPLHSSNLYKYVSWIRSTAAPALKPYKKTALMLNSGAWDVARNNEGLVTSFAEHLQVLSQLITLIRRMLPGTDIIWRSTTAMHVHRGPDIERLMYVSNSRIKTLHDAQVALMEKLNVPVLDLYNYTYEAGWHSKSNDAIHFLDFIHTNILDEIYPDDSIVKDSIHEVYNNNIGVLCKDGIENMLTASK